MAVHRLPPGRPAGDRVLLTWTAHPLASSPRRAALAAAVVLPLWGLALAAGGPWGLGLTAAFTVLPAAVYLFPTTYTLSESGVTLRNPFAFDRKPWSHFVGYQEYPDAVQLLFDRRTPRGWMLRGHLLYFRGNRREVMAVVSSRIGTS